MQKAEEAVRRLARSGEAGLAEFRGEGSTHVWQDTYVFVLDCAKGHDRGRPGHAGAGRQADRRCPFGDVTAAERAAAQCAAAREPGGGWLEYPFPQPGEEQPSRQITYMLAVPGTPYVVGAGVYADEEPALLPRLLAYLEAEVPKIRLRIRTVDRFEVPEQIDRDRMHLAVSGLLTEGAVHHKRCRLYGIDYLVLYDPAQLPLQPPLTLEDYVAVPRVLGSLRGDAHGVVDDALAPLGLRRTVAVPARLLSTVLSPRRGSSPSGSVWRRAAAARADAFLGPSPAGAAGLANSGLVQEPDLEPMGLGMSGPDLGHQRRELLWDGPPLSPGPISSGAI